GETATVPGFGINCVEPTTVTFWLPVMGVVTRPGPTCCCDRAASDHSKTEASTAGRKRRHHALGDAKLECASQHLCCRPGLIARRCMLRVRWLGCADRLDPRRVSRSSYRRDTSPRAMCKQAKTENECEKSPKPEQTNRHVPGGFLTKPKCARPNAKSSTFRGTAIHFGNSFDRRYVVSRTSVTNNGTQPRST